jgi:ribonuclease HII
MASHPDSIGRGAASRSTLEGPLRPHSFATPGLRLEQDLWAQGLRYVGGMDEAGRGALAGPVSAAIVVLPADPGIRSPLSLVRDSKLLTPPERERAAQAVRERALAWGVGYASASEIDEVGILPATRLAMTRAVQSLPLLPEYLLLDYIHWPGLTSPHLVIPKGEWHSLSIAAASVIAKTERDRLMVELDGQYPGYGLARHKGYGTESHREAIGRLGPSAEHRRSFCLGLPGRGTAGAEESRTVGKSAVPLP